MRVNSVRLSGIDKTRKIYLPKGAKWYDFWTNASYSGGQTLRCKATLDIMPIFVKAGSIIPVSEPISLC